ncbi:PBDC1 protein, partial [Polypterus senegalus]
MLRNLSMISLHLASIIVSPNLRIPLVITYRSSSWFLTQTRNSEQLISSVDPKFLRLTKADDNIYKEFREKFPNLNIHILDPEELKSEQAKEEWRPFCMQFDGTVEDYNYGTLLRLNSEKDYTEENTIFGK